MMIVSLNIENYDIHLILIDNKSFANILYYDAFLKIGLFLDQLGRMDSSFVSFTKDEAPVKRVITLPMKMGQYPHRSIAQVDFLVIRAPWCTMSFSDSQA